jgi:hypothetical protein
VRRVGQSENACTADVPRCDVDCADLQVGDEPMEILRNRRAVKGPRPVSET